MFALALVTALGCALLAGAFFVFSAMVMPALRRLPAPQAIAAMQAINVAATRPVFMAAFLGTAALCLALGITALLRLGPGQASTGYFVVGSALYLVGALLLTMGYHVPRNNALASVEPAGADAEAVWGRYAGGWTAWNHVRAAASLAATGALIGGISAP